MKENTVAASAKDLGIDPSNILKPHSLKASSKTW
jgi:hypothetical protein